jgi:hypothetical protein
MAKICVDYRHNGIIVRFPETSEVRWYENWNFLFKRTSPSEAANLLNSTIPSWVEAEEVSFMNLAH